MDHIANLLPDSVVLRFCSLSGLKLSRCVLVFSVCYILFTHASASLLQQVSEPGPNPSPSTESKPCPNSGLSPSSKPCPSSGPTPWPCPKPASYPAPPKPSSSEPSPPKPCQNPCPSLELTTPPAPHGPSPSKPRPKPDPSPSPCPRLSPKPSPEPLPKPGPCPEPVPTPAPPGSSPVEPSPNPDLSPWPSPKPSPKQWPKPGPCSKPSPTSAPPRSSPSQPWPKPSPSPVPASVPTPPRPSPSKPRPKPNPSLWQSPTPTPEPWPKPSPRPGPASAPRPSPEPRPKPSTSAAPAMAPAPLEPSPTPAPPGLLNKTFPAIFAFGDSILDTGNNDYILTLIKADFLPYGMSFPHGVPTGRFCNGKIPSDFIAEFLGVKPTLPPYLRPGLTQEDLLSGVSFASGGSGFDPLTPFVVSAIPMSEQLTYFQEYIEKVKGFVGKEKADHIISKSLAIVIAGSDDLANTYYGSHIRQFLYDLDSYTSFMANSASSFAMQLYESGARKIGFIGLSPIGCIPIQRTTRGGLERKCADKLNVAAQLFNSKLSTSLHSLAKTLSNATLVYIDIYALFNHMIQNPKEYGFYEIDRGCCGTGLVELGPLCNRYTSLLCKNVSSYMFWDSYHPTERAYRILTKKFVETGMGPFYDK